MIEHTNEMERQLSEGVGFRDCFKGTDLRRTEVVVGLWVSSSYEACMPQKDRKWMLTWVRRSFRHWAARI